jgi:hypothetical protein
MERNAKRDYSPPIRQRTDQPQVLRLRRGGEVDINSANTVVVRKNPQDVSQIVYKMMFESRARVKLSENKAGMKRTR